MSSASEEAVTLIFSNHLRVPGDVLEGEVHLNFRFMQHHPYRSVQVKLLGSVFTKVTRTVANTDLVGEETIVLVHDKLLLWTRGEAYPPPNTDILKLPFQFTMPSHGILPTCAFDNKLGISGKVVYWIEVVALRADVNLSRRIPKIFRVQPLDTHGAQLSQSILLGWTGPWRRHTESKPIRKGMWGDYANTTCTFTLPDIDVFPIRTPIPITLEVVTLSKPGKRDELCAKGAIFPAPPRSPRAGVELKLVRDVLIKAKQFDGVRHETLVAYVGGFGHNEDADAAVQTEIVDPVWIPDLANEKKDLGTWKQQVRFKSTMTFQCPSSFKSDTMSLSYTLVLKVEFPGVGNNVKARIPIQLVSNISSSSELSAPPSWDAPPSEPGPEFPPAYTSTDVWDGDVKEK